MDLGDNLGVDDVKLLVVIALDGRVGLVHEVVGCLVLGWINLELHHAVGPRNSFENVGEEYVEADQYVISWNIRNVERFLAVSMHMFSADNRNKVNTKKEGHK
jgi:hypothetical protein